MTEAFVGLGSNRGDRAERLRLAVEGIAALEGTRVLAVSSIYETDPVGEPGSPYFNAVVRIATELDPAALWAGLRGVETALGRPARERSGPRTIDVDLLYYGDRRYRDEELEIPHPRVGERLFVLVPMTELAPGWKDPRNGLRMDHLTRGRGPIDQVRWVGRLRNEER